MRSLRRVFKKGRVKKVALNIIFIVSALVLSFSVYNIAFAGKVFPNVSVAGVPVSGLSQEEAARLLTDSLKVPEQIKIIGQNQIFNLDTKNLGVNYDISTSAQNAFGIGRSGKIANDFLERTYQIIYPKNLDPVVNYNSENLTKFISVISGQVSVEPKDPNVQIIKNQIVVSNGVAGYEVDQELLKSTILYNLYRASGEDIALPIKLIDNSLTETESLEAKERAEKYIGKNIQVKFEFNSLLLRDLDILKLLDLKGGFDENEIGTRIDELSKKIERAPQNPKFTFDNGRVTEFQPAMDGIKTDIDSLKNQLISAITSLEIGSEKTVSFEIPVIRTSPEVSTEKVNNLGIKELIGRGTSTYFHSIPSRVHNVTLATSRINGTLVKPGDTFSFNDTLGDVSAFTGYQQAYIISGGKTILGDGGGVCQVSTTLFRSLLNAGLPIAERAAHAYRVGYYEQNSPPGIDATVYGPSPDLKFVNDTPGYILIEAKADPKHYSLIFELYGTSDGRVATITKPIVTNVSAAPPDVYQDDPTLKAGTVKQIDFKAAGAKVSFSYTVSRGGEQIYKKLFVSNYRPWQAIYLRGTGI